MASLFFSGSQTFFVQCLGTKLLEMHLWLTSVLCIFHSLLISVSPGTLTFLLWVFGSGFWPTVVVFLYRVPVLGWFLQQPFLLAVKSFLF